MMSEDRISPVDLPKVRPYPLRERKSKVKVSDFASPAAAGRSVRDLLDALPRILVGDDFRQLVSAIASAYAKTKPVIAMMGGHVIKCGLSPVIISMMDRGILTGIAMNGAASIHDFEIALIGETSEDVGTNIATGKFGMWEETGSPLHDAAARALADGLGYGEGVGRYIDELNPPYREASLLWRLWKAGIPVTVHAAIGTEIIHQHPRMDGAAVGALTYRDFLIFTSQVANLLPGSAVLNVGSAVLMPEVFVKALAMARNAGHEARAFHSASFDMYDHYRPRVNVVERPTISGGTGHVFLGLHEVLLPALYELVVAEPAPAGDDPQ